MSKIRKYFWCAGSFCNHDKHPMNELTQELKNRKLCKTCFDKVLPHPQIGFLFKSFG